MHVLTTTSCSLPFFAAALGAAGLDQAPQNSAGCVSFCRGSTCDSCFFLEVTFFWRGCRGLRPSVAVVRVTVAFLEVSVFFGAVVRPSVAVVRVTVAFLEVSFFLSTGPS